MSGFSRENTDRWAGATLQDCVRLWATIQKDLMADAEIKIVFPPLVEPSFRPALVICTEGWDAETGKTVSRVWSTRILGNESVGFTYNALYECLIVAYRGMDGFLRGQLELPAS